MKRLAFALALGANSLPCAADDGVFPVRSSYPMQETIERIRQDIAAKAILHFTEIDHARLAVAAGVSLHPSTLVIFGNPALDTLFITGEAQAGLDWPLRLVVTKDERGEVWAVYTEQAP